MRAQKTVCETTLNNFPAMRRDMAVKILSVQHRRREIKPTKSLSFSRPHLLPPPPLPSSGLPPAIPAHYSQPASESSTGWATYCYRPISRIPIPGRIRPDDRNDGIAVSSRAEDNAPLAPGYNTGPGTPSPMQQWLRPAMADIQNRTSPCQCPLPTLTTA